MKKKSVIIAAGLLMYAMAASEMPEQKNMESLAIAAEGIFKQEETVANNMNTVLLLQEERWQELELTERMQVLQTVADIEADYLGLPNKLEVKLADLEEEVLGRYFDAAQTIQINQKHFWNSTAEQLVNAVCHEVRHSYQFRLVDVYRNMDADYLELRIFQEIATYEEEFNNYIDPLEDFEGYYYQECEIDAREYSEWATRDYYKKIYEYFMNL